MKQTLFDALAPPTEEEQQEAFCSMVNFEYFCNKFAGEIGDWLEENDPNDIVAEIAGHRICGHWHRCHSPHSADRSAARDESTVRTCPGVHAGCGGSCCQ